MFKYSPNFAIKIKALIRNQLEKTISMFVQCYIQARLHYIQNFTNIYFFKFIGFSLIRFFFKYWQFVKIAKTISGQVLLNCFKASLD